MLRTIALIYFNVVGMSWTCASIIPLHFPLLSGRRETGQRWGLTHDSEKLKKGKLETRDNRMIPRAMLSPRVNNT